MEGTKLATTKGKVNRIAKEPLTSPSLQCIKFYESNTILTSDSISSYSRDMCESLQYCSKKTNKQKKTKQTVLREILRFIFCSPGLVFFQMRHLNTLRNTDKPLLL